MTQEIKPKVREYFIFDNKVVNEQKCKDDGYLLLERDEVETVEIHFHKSDLACTERVELEYECYVIRKGDLT